MWYYRLKIASTPYGYWLDPNGIPHVVSQYGHEKKMQELDLDSYYQAFSKGYIRIVSPSFATDDLDVQLGIECNFVLPTQIGFLTNLIRTMAKEARSLGFNLFVDLSNRNIREVQKALRPHEAIEKLQTMISPNIGKK